MNIYHRLYTNLISHNVNKKELWENKENGLHRHHIIPKHMGGAAGAKRQIENKIGIHDPANFQKNAILGGKAIKGMICVTNGAHRTRIRPEKLNEYLSNGYRRGFTLFSSNES